MIANQLAELRRSRGVSAAKLALAVNVSRQTIYAIEAGTYVPNTAVALRLAGFLGVAVEELFRIEPPAAPLGGRTERVTLLPGGIDGAASRPMQLCRVDGRLIAAETPLGFHIPAGDAWLQGRSRGGHATARVHDPESNFSSRILMAGCDPAMSIVAKHAARAGVDLVIAHRNSSQALSLLEQGSIHIAGTHLAAEHTGLTRTHPVAVFHFAIWETGMATAPGNPKSVRAIGDLLKPGVTMINREPGSGTRLLIDNRLQQAGIAASQVRGYTQVALGHLPAAAAVAAARADACFTTEAAARVYGLEFVPLTSERYDLVIREEHAAMPEIRRLLDTLCALRFRQELESAGGYQTRNAGQRVERAAC